MGKVFESIVGASNSAISWYSSFFLWKLQNKLGSSCTAWERSQPANGGDQLSQFLSFSHFFSVFLSISQYYSVLQISISQYCQKIGKFLYRVGGRSQPANGGDQLSQFRELSLPIPNMVQQFRRGKLWHHFYWSWKIYKKFWKRFTGKLFYIEQNQVSLICVMCVREWRLSVS